MAKKSKMKKLLANITIKKIIIAVSVALFAGVGAWILQGGFAASPTASKDCGSTTVTNYSYQVPFGNAVWNQKVCNLPRYAKSAEYAERFFNWSNVNDGTEPSIKRRGKIGAGPSFPKPTPTDPEGTRNIWSRNVYYASDAITTTKVHAHAWPSNLDGSRWNSMPIFAKPGYSSHNPDTSIPWNPAWTTGQAGDNEIVILDESNGRIYELWGYWKTDFDRAAKCQLADRNRICTMSASIGRDIDGDIIDYRTFEGLHGDRGAGFSKFITFTMPEEILAGEIRHALGVAIPSVMYGPQCTAAQLGSSAEGETCGFALAPATKLELVKQTTATHLEPQYQSLYTLNKTVPEGMRFALDISESDIDNWISSQDRFKNNSRLAETARVYAHALRDYGFMVVDTSGNGTGIQVAGTSNPKDRQLWEQVGIKEGQDGSTLLDGLVTKERLYVVDPPTVTCNDGTKTKYYCAWRTASYDGSVTPPPPPTDTAKPVVNITSPGNPASVNGTITITATATDNVAVTKVELLVDGVVKDTKTTGVSPYSFPLDTKQLSNANHTVTIKAYDAANNMADKTITIVVNNPITPPPPPPAFRPLCDFIGTEGEIDAQDLAHVIYYFNKAEPVTKGTKGDCSPVDPPNNPNPDMTQRGNGKVELDDLSLLIRQWVAQRGTEGF